MTTTKDSSIRSTKMTATLTEPIRFYSIFDGNFDSATSPLFQLYGMKRVNLESNPRVVVFNGGADIGTSIYGEKPCEHGGPLAPSQRDLDEIDIWKQIKDDPEVLKVGICRGSQLLNCLNGGTLWQDVNGHNRGDHLMTIIETGEKMVVTSTHHQMMRPTKEAIIIAVANEATQKRAEHDICRLGNPHLSTGKFNDDYNDTEIVYYPSTHTLCIQGHPEYVPHSDFARFCIDLIINKVSEMTHADA